MVAILFGTELGIFQRILGTVSLTGQQWVVCLLGASTILVVSEARKFWLRRHEQAPKAGTLAIEPTAS